MADFTWQNNIEEQRERDREKFVGEVRIMNFTPADLGILLEDVKTHKGGE